jgi:hypothetical protein
VKNRKNDMSDASLQVDFLGDVRGFRSGARSPIREAFIPRFLPLENGERKGGVVLLP